MSAGLTSAIGARLSRNTQTVTVIMNMKYQPGVCFVGCLDVRPGQSRRNSKPSCGTSAGSRRRVSLASLHVTHTLVSSRVGPLMPSVVCFVDPRADRSHNVHQTASAASALLVEVSSIFTHSTALLFSPANKLSSFGL